MMNKAIALLLGLLLVQPVCAVELFGTVEEVSGDATVTDATGASRPVTSGLKVFSGQSIQTAADGEVHIVTEDSGLIALRPNSSFRIERYQAKGESSDEVVFSLLKGALRSITGWIAKRNASAYRLNTPTTTIGVRGTDHETTVIDVAMDDDQPGTFDTVYEGVTVMQSPRGEIEVRPGEHAFAPRDGAAAPRLLARHPGFMQRRVLRLEHRIQQRKEHLSPQVQHRLQERIGEMRDVPGDRRIRNHREDAKKKIEQRRPRERRNP
jgi:hypothetical protein